MSLILIVIAVVGSGPGGSIESPQSPGANGPNESVYVT